MKMRSLFISCLFLWFNLGCLIIPMGHKNHELSGSKIEERDLGFIIPGKTTKAELIQKVGQPYLIMDEWGVMAYYWRMLAAYMPWFIAAGYSAAAGVETIGKDYILFVAYDNKDCITKYEVTSSFLSGKTVNEQAIHWAGKGELAGKFTALPIPQDKSVVYVFRPGWHAGDENEKICGVILDGNLWSEIRWGQYTPIVLPPGSCKIGVEPAIRESQLFVHPKRRAQKMPLKTTTIQTFPNQAYFLKIAFIKRSAEELEVFFAMPSENEAMPTLAKLKRAR